MQKAMDLIPSTSLKLGTVAHACNPSTWEGMQEHQKFKVIFNCVLRISPSSVSILELPPKKGRGQGKVSINSINEFHWTQPQNKTKKPKKQKSINFHPQPSLSLQFTIFLASSYQQILKLQVCTTYVGKRIGSPRAAPSTHERLPPDQKEEDGKARVTRTQFEAARDSDTGRLSHTRQGETNHPRQMLPPVPGSPQQPSSCGRARCRRTSGRRGPTRHTRRRRAPSGLPEARGLQPQPGQPESRGPRTAAWPQPRTRGLGPCLRAGPTAVGAGAPGRGGAREAAARRPPWCRKRRLRSAAPAALTVRFLRAASLCACAGLKVARSWRRLRGPNRLVSARLAAKPRESAGCAARKLAARSLRVHVETGYGYPVFFSLVFY
jgi:hypothetical protein